MLDNASLLIGIAFSSAALMIALLIGWLHSRQQIYLVHGAAGMGLVVISLFVMGLRGDRYDLMVQLIPFTILLAGLSLVYSGARLFNNPDAGFRQPLLLGTIAITLTAIPLVVGYSGLGTIMLNLGCALLMFLSGWQYWRGRNDMRLPLLANATLYTLSALSFLACAIVLTLERQWILDAPPSNWAENFNSIMSLVGLTGIGAISLTLHHARAARLHRDEANTDSLTGVLNRRALFSRYSETDIVSGLAVVMFDLDHFKLINDRLGHAQGDIVLQSFAQVLKSELRSDDVIARLGGEEFCVILPGLDRDTAHKAAERVRLAFAAMSIAIGDHGEIATVSAGIAAGGIDETFSSTLRRADAALYKAKKSGRNQVHVAALRLVA
jgi:diguanylate cyclase (GGDEF)-like protein